MILGLFKFIDQLDQLAFLALEDFLPKGLFSFKVCCNLVVDQLLLQNSIIYLSKLALDLFFIKHNLAIFSVHEFLKTFANLLESTFSFIKSPETLAQPGKVIYCFCKFLLIFLLL